MIVGGGDETRAQPASGGQPAEAVVENVEREQRHPEGGHRHAEEAEHPQAAVDRAASLHGGEHAERYTYDDRNDDGK